MHEVRVHGVLWGCVLPCPTMRVAARVEGPEHGGRGAGGRFYLVHTVYEVPLELLCGSGHILGVWTFDGISPQIRRATQDGVFGWCELSEKLPRFFKFFRWCVVDNLVELSIAGAHVKFYHHVIEAAALFLLRVDLVIVTRLALPDLFEFLFVVGNLFIGAVPLARWVARRRFKYMKLHYTWLIHMVDTHG